MGILYDNYFYTRRASEPARTELSEYVSRPDWRGAANEELVQTLRHFFTSLYFHTE